MNKIYYLKTCDKCRKILKELEQSGFILEKQEIKTTPVTAKQLEEMKKLAGSYQALFSKFSRKYRTLKNRDSLTEEEYKNLILSEYTFLKRPIILIKAEIFVAVNIKTIDSIKQALND